VKNCTCRRAYLRSARDSRSRCCSVVAPIPICDAAGRNWSPKSPKYMEETGQKQPIFFRRIVILHSNCRPIWHDPSCRHFSLYRVNKQICDGREEQSHATGQHNRFVYCFQKPGASARVAIYGMDGCCSLPTINSRFSFATIMRDDLVLSGKKQPSRLEPEIRLAESMFMSNETTVEQAELTMARIRVAPQLGPHPVRYGLPCANCTLYYSAELTACPICKCQERVSPTVTSIRSTVRL
jgi:hypothetical protein